MPDPNNLRITLPPINIIIKDGKDGQQATLEWAKLDQIQQATQVKGELPDNGKPKRYEIKAYPVSGTEGWILEPASPRRDWMDEIPHGFAYRCLPLVMANQLGWIVRCPTDFEVVWNGEKSHIGSLDIRFPEQGDRYKNFISSHFGFGILTFSLPWLFRTPEDIMLVVRGATNFFKFNASPLDGLIETDWSPYTFTMNWKIVEKNIPVRFSKGDPICMLVPYPIDLIERFEAINSSLESEPTLLARYKQWVESRQSFNAKKGRTPKEWQKNYYGGKHPDGAIAPKHRTSIKLSRFQDPPS